MVKWLWVCRIKSHSYLYTADTFMFPVQDVVHDRILVAKVTGKIKRYDTIENIDKTVLDELIASVRFHIRIMRHMPTRSCADPRNVCQ